MSKIKSIKACEVLDSRGNPTVEATVILSDGISAASQAPSGQSSQIYEAVELRDHDEGRYKGMGVLQAVANVNEIIAKELEGMDVFNQQDVDRKMIELDGTQNKSKLGSNAIYSVSCAIAKAGAKSAVLPLPLYIRQFMGTTPPKKMPIPMFSMLEGGNHGGEVLNFQEYLAIPASSKSLSESLEIGFKVYRELKRIIHERSLSSLVAEKGGFSPSLSTNQEAFMLIREAIEAANYSFSLDLFLGMDAGADHFIDGKTYKLKDRTIPYSSSDLAEFYKNLMDDFSLIYIEDPFAQDDWDGWKKMYAELGAKTIVAGGDVISTNPYRLQIALENKVVNGIVIKPNQAGTVTESIAVVEIARFKEMKIIVSDRSGESMDHFVADFAVGVSADYVKFGAPVHERVIKYNKLLKIEQELAHL